MLLETIGPSLATLKALSETCHALKELAQPILYHYPDIKTYTPFFKTVTKRPTLAASVKVLARIYESGWNWAAPGPARHDNEDFTYLIKLAQDHGLNDDPANCVDYWAEDDGNFKRCFRFLNDTSDGDQIGYTMDMAQQSYFCLLTALQLAILPNLEFVSIDLYDGLDGFGSRLLNSLELLLPYPYLPQVVAARPDHFARISTIIFQSPYHYRQDSLGLERVAFLFPVLTNIRVAFFDRLLGQKNNHYQEPHPPPPSPELSWPALSRLEEIYFSPCARPRAPAPLVAISKLLQRCSQLKKLVYRHKYPGRKSPDSFAPAALVEAVVPVKHTLLHLEMYCSSAKIPIFPIQTLVGSQLREFTLLRTLVIDEEFFCQHWLSDSYLDSCLVDILPAGVSSLTVRLHDKYKAVPDILRLGRDVASGHYPQLTRLQVYVLRDVAGPLDPWNNDEHLDAFDSDDYFLHGVQSVQWEEAIQALADTIRPTVLQAFDGTDVAVKVEYLYEVTVSEEQRL